MFRYQNSTCPVFAFTRILITSATIAQGNYSSHNKSRE